MWVHAGRGTWKRASPIQRGSWDPHKNAGAVMLDFQLVLTGDLAFFYFFYFFLSYTVLLAPFLLRILNQSLTGECTRDKAETGARKQTLKMGL